MMPLTSLLWRLRALVGRRRSDAELDEEIETHLSLIADDEVRRGISRTDATFKARAAFGGVANVKETYRDQRGLPFLETLAQDLRFAVRGLRRNPAFASTAIITLALGIGANTAIFSLIDALMLRTLPVERPHELIRLHTVGPRNIDDNFSYAALRQFQVGAAHVVDVLGASATRGIRATVDGESELLNRKSVSGNYFAVLGVPAAAGRMLTNGDDDAGAGPRAIVISHRYWTRRFGQDHRAIGRTVTIGPTVFTIAGVAAPGFLGETVGEAPDVWTPLTADVGRPADVWTGHSTTWLRLVARRRPSTTVDDAHAALEPIFTTITHETAAATKIASFRNQALQSRLGIDEGSRGYSPVRERLGGPLYVLMAVVGLVLLIACANVANLLLARAAARAREMSLRVALGAGRFRLIRQLLVESLLLSAAGGALGLVVGVWAAGGLLALASKTPLPLRLDVRPDMRMLAFTAFVSFATAIVFGLLPALRSARSNLVPALKNASALSMRRRGFRLGKSLVIGQIAVSLVLLVAAALFVRSLMNLRSIDLGFNPDHVLVLRVDMSSAGAKVPLDERRNIYARVIERAGSVPGVRGASVSVVGLLSANNWGNRITVEGRTAPPDEPERTFANAISPRYFEVMGMQILRGRPFSHADRANAPPVAVVNETFARQFFNDPSPIGRRVGLGAPATIMMEIIGVVSDAKYSSMRESAVPMLYVPLTQYDGQLPGQLQVRTAADPAALAAQLRRELGSVDGRMAIVDVMEMQDAVDASLIGETLIAKLSSLFGLLALLLSAVGLYGVVAYMSAQRSVEIGIRMALGADHRSVVWLVLRQVLMLVVGGMLLGAPVAFFASRLVANQLYGMTPNDPVTLVIAVAVLCTVAVVAGCIPARKAAKVNPIVALRAD
jgi:predicted permease